MVARADGSQPAPSGGKAPSIKAAAKRAGSDIGDAGQNIGRELAKAGKQVGHGTAKTAQSIGHKVSSDVKHRNFKPKAQRAEPSADRGRGNDQK